MSRHVDSSGATTQSPREPEPVWRRPVVKPAMSDALWEATRTEVLGNDVFQRIPRPANYEQYQVSKPHTVTTGRMHSN